MSRTMITCVVNSIRDRKLSIFGIGVKLTESIDQNVLKYEKNSQF